MSGLTESGVCRPWLLRWKGPGQARGAYYPEEMTDQTSSFAQVERLFGLVERDQGLRRSVRERVKRLRSLLPANPELAYERLCALATRVAAELQRDKPSQALARFVSVEVFYLYHLIADVRAFFSTPEAYRRFLDEQSDVDAAVTAHLSPDDPVFPARHSWLVPASQTARMDGKETINALQLRGKPPLVRFSLPLKSLRAAQVTVRDTRAVDAVCERFAEWNPAGPSPGVSELIDGNVPRSAVERAELRR